MTEPLITVSARGVSRWRRGHPWIYRSDVDDAAVPPGVVRVRDRRGRDVGRALWSPVSEIRLRMLTSEDAAVTGAWWRARLQRALARRAFLAETTTAYRVVHAEGDGLPSLVVDRYGDVVVAQLLSAGLEAVRDDVLDAITATLRPRALLLRNDASVRRHENLPLTIDVVMGDVPDVVEVREGAVTYVVAPRTGQKTGAFLDQRENRRRAGGLARGRCLDVFTYQGLFALHLAAGAERVLAVDSSGPALEVARRNAELNRRTNIEWAEADAFDVLRDLERRGERFDVVVLDPPAFAKQRAALARALRAYKEINLRALRLLAPAGHLLTHSCSFHVDRARFLAMVAAAAGDSRRRVVAAEITTQPADHPEVLTIPETGYLKGAVVQAAD